MKSSRREITSSHIQNSPCDTRAQIRSLWWHISFVFPFSVLLSLVACQTQESLEPILLDSSELPEYEHSLDHAGIISNWSEEFYHHGLQVYRTNCFSCHGTPDIPGTLPHSRQFWKESFKYGNDPLSLYNTLTLGRGLMPPQLHLVPKEKYAVILFIREQFLHDLNPDAYFEVTPSYLNQLPGGTSLGPPSKRSTPWKEMDYGRFLMRTYEVAHASDGSKEINHTGRPIPNEDFSDRNFAYKGIAIRLDPGTGGVAAGNAFVLFDHDLMRMAAFWTGKGFIDWEDILLDDQHNVFPRIVGDLHIETSMNPGWANPITGALIDPRFRAVDGRQFGPLPKSWAHYQGLYVYDQRVILRYSVGEAQVLESYTLEADTLLARTINVTNVKRPLTLNAAPDSVELTIISPSDGMLTSTDGVLQVAVTHDVNFKLIYGGSDIVSTPAEDLSSYKKGSLSEEVPVLQSPILSSTSEGYVVDVLTLPVDTPWRSRIRPTAIDFMTEGNEAIVTTIDGDVWHLSGITRTSGSVEWRRIASGLFQPLGVRVIEGEIYVGSRNQIARLHDLNGDMQIDYYESFNNDHQVTEHFHEFAMGLQADEAGNFYYAKSARHARRALVPQHGTLIRVSPDGKQSTILATGFRAANGVTVNPDNSFMVTDQEGHWNPMNRINLVEPGGFYGNMYGYGAPPDSSDAAMMQPLMWIDMKHDRSPAELLWATSDRWGPLSNKLLSFSYGYGRIFLVMPQSVENTLQAGIVQLPLADFPTGLMRGRMNPADGQLYVVGMSAWATSQMIQTGGIYRIRYNGGAVRMPVSMRVLENAVEISFTSALQETSATRPSNYEVITWDLLRSRQYGSDRYNMQKLRIASISLNDSTILLSLPGLKPTWILEINYDLVDSNGIEFTGVIQSTVHAIGK
ncbi:MAG: hypothetical protein OXE92_09475 [Bacteroidetes bacterium]|nr:hypothetical protein [Bacteroidota bacterium]